jgi:hypothetical protein
MTQSTSSLSARLKWQRSGSAASLFGTRREHHGNTAPGRSCQQAAGRFATAGKGCMDEHVVQPKSPQSASRTNPSRRRTPSEELYDLSLKVARAARRHERHIRIAVASMDCALSFVDLMTDAAVAVVTLSSAQQGLGWAYIGIICVA